MLSRNSKLFFVKSCQGSRKMHLLKQKAYIGQDWVSAASNRVFEVKNPVNGAVIGTVPDMDTTDVEIAIRTASEAFSTWKDTTAKERSQVLRKWYDLLAQNQNSLAEIVTSEAGKPLVESQAEVNYANSFIDFFASVARHIHGEIIPSPVTNKKIMVEKQPIGVVGIITPWNFPLAMVTRKAGAALAAGCTCVIRPAEDTPLSALALMELADKAGVPKGVLNVVTSDRANAGPIGALLCESPLVAGISFTGSTQVGKILYKQCAQGIKRLSLELGGNAPFIVYKSANLDTAVEGAMASKFRNCGQTCVASNRFFVQDQVFDEFVSRMLNAMKNLKLGDGVQPGVHIGPLINKAQFQKVSALVQDALSKGARLVTGGKPVSHLGELFYEPTLLTDIKETMRVHTEEVFGPVVNVTRFQTEEESLMLANNHERGLAGYFFSEDVSQIFRVSRRLEVGMVGVNEGAISTCEAPFGGIKESGLGREGSHHAIDDFTFIKIQQVDGGFFEKFGSLFREQAEQTVNEEIAEKKRVAEAAAQIIPEGSVDNAVADDSAAHPGDADSESEGPSSSDSESEEHKGKADFICVAWNIDELYSEILYEILHNVGCDVSYEIGQTALFSYAQDAFKISNDKHNMLLQESERKEAPDILLNVEIVEAKDLRAKDSNGLSDPFVTLYLASNTTHRYNTSVKEATLNPMWEEHFALPIVDNTKDDTLCLEVWDFDPAESVKEKLGKIFEVKGVKGIRKLVKEIAVTAATGQHENELIGIAKIPLKTIPASGMTMWYSLDKKNKVTRQGVVKIRISFSSQKNTQVAEQEHRHLLRIILLHELEMSKVAPHWWCGTFSPQGEALLTQHIAQSGLTIVEVALCQWSVYAGIHQNHALSFTLFSNLLDKLVKPLQTGSVCDEDVKIFWDSAKKLLPSCFSIIRKIRKRGFKDKMTVKQVTEALNILNNIGSLEPLPNTDLFPSTLYPWITYNGDEPNCDIEATINDAVNQGASDWFNHIVENNIQQTNSDAGKLQHLIQVIQLVRSDLQKAIEFYDKLFQESVNFQYAKALYIFYQAKISTIAEPDVVNICKSLKRLNFTALNLNEATTAAPLAEGTILFEVYLALQRFVVLGQGLCPVDCDTFHIRNFHQWFHGGVAQWLDIAVYKALQRIEKAVELDKLLPVDSTLKYSSSAVDTLTIFYQVKVFWQQLNWPDAEGSYTFIAKIIDDICRCCVFYAERMSTRVDGMGETQDIYEKRFEVTDEWCLAINNIEYVRQSLEPFTDELGMSDVIEQLSELKSPLEAQRCQHTLKNVIANAIDTVRNEIIEIMETVVSKMAPAMKRLLIEGAELFNQDSNSVDRLMMYVDNNLQTLHNELNEENFNRILEIVWDALSEILNEIIQSNLEKRRPPSFFANLHKTLNLMLGSFKSPEQRFSCDVLQRTEELLKINGLETSDLIHRVYLDLHQQYISEQDSPYGELSARAKFEENTLQIEVINARNLIAMDSNGSCDPFVRLHFLPEEKFSAISKPKTQAHNKTQFPLFDEKFTISLTEDQRGIKDGLILFSVKDKDLLGYNNQYVGEAFIQFSEIPTTNEPISSLPQVRLQLGRPKDLTLDSVKALEYRQGDKQAKEFLKKFRQKMRN